MAAPFVPAPSRMPPGPEDSPDEQARRWMEDPCGLLDSCHARFGDLFTLRLGTFGTIAIVADPDGVRQVFGAPPDRYECRHFNDSYRYAMGDNALFLQDGAQHRALKALLAPAFAPAALRDHAERVRRIVAETIVDWPAFSPLRLRPALHEITLRGLLALVFGGPCDLSEPLIDAFRAKVWADLRSWKPWTAQSRLRPAIAGSLDRALERLGAQPGADAPGLLAHMFRARSAEGAPWTRHVIQDQITMLMITAGDAVAVAASWALYRAARHPAERQQLRAEQRAADPAVPAAELLERPVLAAFTRESLRLHPVLPTVSGRRLTQPCRFMGYDLPAGVTLAPCQYLVHRRGALYPDPLAFRPARFEARRYQRHQYFPFGGAERACLGAWLAPLSVAIIVDTILAHFDLAITDGAMPRPVRHGTLIAPDPALALAFRPRNRS